MSYARYGDEFPDDKRWDGVTYPARWHYIGIVAACSKAERYECLLPLRLALRASDVLDPQAAIDELVAAGFMFRDGTDVGIVNGEERHMPPPSVRDQTRKRNQREWTRKHRQAKCDRGDHDAHCPRNCPDRLGNASGKALPQDRTGQGTSYSVTESYSVAKSQIETDETKESA